MNKDQLSPGLVRQLFVLLSIVLLGYLIIEELMPYFSGILGAITMYVIFKNLMKRLVRYGFKHWLAATIIIIISIVIIIIPVSLIILLLSSKIQKAVANSEEVMAIIKTKVLEIEQYVGFNLSTELNTKEITGWISNQIQGLAGGTFDAVIALTIMYFILYFLLIDSKNLQKRLLNFIPLSDENINLISKESSEVVKSNAIGIPLVALLQGVIALIGYYIFGVQDPIFWFVVTVVGSMIPFVGTALGVLPVTLLLYTQGDQWQAIGLLIYGIAVVGSTDNIFRMVVQRRLANLHPLITLIGVIIGVPLFGFIGLIFGPLLLSLFLLLVKIYKNEYGRRT